MRKLNIRTLIIYALAGLSGVMLLYTSQNVQKAEDRLAAIKAEAENETETIRVLKAEWAYLNSPARLEMLAQQFLALEQPDPESIISEPSFLPLPMIAEGQEEKLYQEISYEEPEPEPASGESVAPPPKKPSVPKRKDTKSEKSFDALLNELGDGGAQ